MPRHARNDGPGRCHHVMNRGIARRTLFESRHDIRTFLSRLALAVRAGLIEVQAYCILTTHFHLLVRSPEGELAAAMSIVQNSYSRWFNRSRRRDGPLYRSRYRSKRADSLTYRRHLVRYIDANPVAAGLAATPALYPHGSARFYAQTDGPIWLSRDWVERTVKLRAGRDKYDPCDYPLAFGKPLSPRLVRLIEKRMSLSNDSDDPLDDLLGAAPQRVAEWMRRKAALADGTEVGMPVCDVDDVDEVLRAAELMEGRWNLTGTVKPQSAWPIVHVALLRELCGSTLHDAATRTGTTVNGAWKRYARHKSCVDEGGEYALRAAELACRAMQACHRADGENDR